MPLPDLTKRETFSSAMQMIILLTVLSLAPAILIMMTSFTRIIIVLALLRQALGTQQLPPNQILTGLALFMTFLVMGPTWQRVNSEAIQPYMDGKMEQKAALSRRGRAAAEIHDRTRFARTTTMPMSASSPPSPTSSSRRNGKMSARSPSSPRSCSAS